MFLIWKKNTANTLFHMNKIALEYKDSKGWHFFEIMECVDGEDMASCHAYLEALAERLTLDELGKTRIRVLS